MNVLNHLKTTGRTTLMAFAVALLAASCSNNDYVNAIPSSATAIVKVDVKQLGVEEGTKAFASLLPKDINVEGCGVDWSSTAYAFETVDGNFGICAKVKSESQLKETFEKANSEGKCGSLRKQGDFTFTDINNCWAVGFSSKALIVVGPVSAAALGDAQRKITKMLRQDEDASIITRPMFAKLDSMESSVAMVAQVQALPEKMVAPFTIGAPKDADASQVLVAVDFDKEDKVVRMKGETFSFNKSVDEALKKANSTYRKINGDFLDKIPNTCSIGLFTNVDGKQFLPLLQNNKALQALLVGINTAIDFDNIIRSVDGDLTFTTTALGGSDNMDMTMFARVKNPAWTADVDYWKQSCAKGCSITGTNGAWSYNGGNTRFAFGLEGDMFYGTTDAKLVPEYKGEKPQPIADKLKKEIQGNRMVLMLNIKGLTQGEALSAGVGSIVKPIPGDVDAVIYVVK